MVLPGTSPIAGKPVRVAFDGGRLTSDAGVLLLADIERRLGIAERLALALFHAHYDGRCFLPIHVYEAITGKRVAVILRPRHSPP